MSNQEVSEAEIALSAEAIRARLTTLTQLAMLGLQSLILVNGGALIALFTLIAQGTRTPFIAHVYPPTLWCSFLGFVVGIISAIASIFVGYVSQLSLSEAEQLELISKKEVQAGLADQTSNEKKKDSLIDRGNAILKGAIALNIISLAGFIVGSGFALYAALGSMQAS